MYKDEYIGKQKCCVLFERKILHSTFKFCKIPLCIYNGFDNKLQKKNIHTYKII